jgi:hypothetical protein
MTSVFVPRVLALTLAFSGAAIAQDAAPRAVEQRLHEEVQAVLLRLIENGELRAEDAEDLSLIAPVSQQVDLGAILDVRYRADADAGLPVLGVTPGGSAAQLGLQAGDRLLGVNGESLQGLGGDAQGRAVAVQRLRQAIVDTTGDVELRIARAGQEQVLRGPVQVVSLPAYRLELGAALAQASLAANSPVSIAGDDVSKCGRVSTFDIAPRRQQLFRAVLIAVDGNLPGPSMSDTYRLTPGRHTLTVAEAIDARRIGALQAFDRSRMGPDRYKKMEVDIQPGVTYRLAARYFPRERGPVREGAYWEPAIWKEFPEVCR